MKSPAATSPTPPAAPDWLRLPAGAVARLRPVSTATPVAPEVARQSLLNATACTLAPGLLVMRAIERLGSTLATQNGMIGPISPILTGVLFLDDPFAPGLVAGTLLALSGVRMPARAR